MINFPRVTDILDQFDSLDMIVNSKDTKQDLLFDLSDYKAQKEVSINSHTHTHTLTHAIYK